MTVTNASFRATFPEFASTTRYPDTAVDLWLAQALRSHDAFRWGDSLDLGVCLYTAHRLALGALNAAAAAAGGVPGYGIGVVASQGASKVNVSFDTGSGTHADDGHWNMTTYGTQWRELMRLAGAGPLQVGGDDYEPTPAAWAGPYIN